MCGNCENSSPYVSDRPARFGLKLLNLIDIKPGLRIQRWHNGQKMGVVTVAGYPYFDHQAKKQSGLSNRNTIWIDTETDFTFPNAGRLSLSDMGITTAENGSWSRTNYSTKAEDLVPVQLQANNAVDFFARAKEWLDQMDIRGSAYQHESSVTMVIPRNLQTVILEHQVTVTVGHHLCQPSRSVAVNFIYA